MRSRIFTTLLLLLPGAFLFWIACDSKPTDPVAGNPFDPDNADPFNLTAFIANDNVTLSWREIAGPSITGFTLFRMTDRESLFTRVDTADSDATSWIDPAPAHFTQTYYRIAAIGESGAESDTTGRGIDTLDIPPLFSISGGSPVQSREIVLLLGAEGADSMIVWADSGAAAEWEVFSDTKMWTLESGFDTTLIYSILSRTGEERSDTLIAIAVPARTEGTLELAGGDSLVARSLLDVQLGGTVVTRLILSENMLFDGVGEDTLLFDLNDTLYSPDTLLQWQFDVDPVPKTMFARFENDFGIDTIAADTVWPDSLRNILVVLANGETTTTKCVVSAALTANATLMNPVAGFPPEGWVGFDSTIVFFLPDTTAGDFIFEVLFSNDFINSSPAPARDTITFTPIEMAVVITSPAHPETTITTVSDTTIDTEGEEPDTLITAHEDTAITYATFEDGDSITVEGSNVAASCTARPDSVAVQIGSTPGGSIKAVASWSFDGVIAESLIDTTLIDIIATATDEKDSASSDTVTVRIVPSPDE